MAAVSPRTSSWWILEEATGLIVQPIRPSPSAKGHAEGHERLADPYWFLLLLLKILMPPSSHKARREQLAHHEG
jgi:hypothetical protein